MSKDSLRDDEKKALKRLIRSGCDFVFDLRHWQWLCRLSRETNKTVTEVLAGILEKVFVNDLKWATERDDSMDEDICAIRAQIIRFRKQPQKLQKFLEQRKQELLLIADCFPEELDPEMEDIVSRLRYAYKPPSPGELKPKSVTVPDNHLKNLTRRLRFKKQG